MAEKLKRNCISIMKTWIKNNQITVFNVLTTVLLVGAAITFMLIRGSSLQRQSVEESIVNLAGMTAREVQSYYLVYSDVARSISQIMKNYDSIEVSKRRSFFSDTMRDFFVSNRALVSVYTLWFPDELDGLDAVFAGSADSDETGQFMTGFTRENGLIEKRAFPEYRYLLYAAASDELPSETISDPFRKIINRQEAWVVDVRVPIVREEKLAGLIGATINLEQLQYLIQTRRPYGTGRTLVSTGNGTVIAHNDAELRGITFRAPDSRDPLFSPRLFNTILQGIQKSIESQQHQVIRTSDNLIVCYPLSMASPLLASRSTITPWTVITTVPVSAIMAPINALFVFSLLFIFGAGVVAAFVLFVTSRSLARHAKALHNKLQSAITMQDNLKAGLFLMDRNYSIHHGTYSKILEKILSVPDLDGKNFIELLGNSVKPAEKQGLADYFEMIFKKSFDAEMLESINPINDLCYVSAETGEVKNLRTSFTLTEQGRQKYIMCAVEDITAEKELDRQISEAESLRENEMRSLFQVIQMDPRIAGDFVSDVEHEFNSINELLKSRKEIHADLLVELFQSVHAIKSDALVLDLDNFSSKLHKLENSIKALQEKYDEVIPFDDFLGLVFELNDIIRDKDQLKAAIFRIQNYKTVSGEYKNQEKYILTETLANVCNTAQTALNKKVRLVVDEMDDVVRDYGIRKVIKEVLSQLVRNAVYHGIETPDERRALGKEPEGEIRLSVKYVNNRVFIMLTDDGGGIDLSRVRKKAGAYNLSGNDSDSEDKSRLMDMIFSPGFSTLSNADYYAGRGIGLSLVKDRVKEFGGKIDVSTVAGKGTTFKIEIPIERSDIGFVS